jgi:XTP/dITP diphosphohydrolase
MQSLCIASGNSGKLDEIRSLLNGTEFLIYNQADLNIESIPETGSTFVENAIIKARHAAQVSHLPTIADDSGLCIDRLNQAPGIHSSYYAGENATPEQNIQKILENIASFKGVPIKARLVTVICFMADSSDQIPLLITEILEGELLHAPRGRMWGYDAIFFLPELGKTLGELSIHEKNQVSARGRAMKKLREHLLQKYDFKI